MGNTFTCCEIRGQLLKIQRLQALDESFLQQVEQLRLKHIDQLHNAKVHYFGKTTFVGSLNQNSKKVGYGQMYNLDNVLLCVFQNDLPNGYGIIIKDYSQYFKGELKDGLYHGKGRQYSQKHQYQGDYENGSRKKGLLVTQQLKYHGQFSDNVFQGSGQLILKSGIIYQGHFSKGKYEGHGTITYSNQNRYQGGFSQGNYHGKGKFEWKDGVKVFGSYHKGTRAEGAKFEHAKESKIDSSRTIQQQKLINGYERKGVFEIDEQRFSKRSAIVRGNGTLQLF